MVVVVVVEVLVVEVVVMTDGGRSRPLQPHRSSAVAVVAWSLELGMRLLAE